MKLKVFWKNLIKRKQINFLNQNPTFGILAFSFFSAKSFSNEIKTHAPKTYKKVEEVFFGEKKVFEFITFPEKKFKLLPNQSIDKGLMEKTKNATITVTDVDWSDIGSWQGVLECLKKDKQNNYSNHKNLIFKNVKNSLVWSSNPEKKIVGVNIDNLIIVEEDDTTLIMNKDKKNNDELKNVVEELKEKNIFLLMFIDMFLDHGVSLKIFTQNKAFR